MKKIAYFICKPFYLFQLDVSPVCNLLKDARASHNPFMRTKRQGGKSWYIILIIFFISKH